MTTFCIKYRSPGSVSVGRSPSPTLIKEVLQHPQIEDVVNVKRVRLEVAKQRREQVKEERKRFFEELKGFQESKKSE